MMLTPGRVGGIGFRPIAKARAMACGSNPRALPDLMATASAADPTESGAVSSLLLRKPETPWSRVVLAYVFALLRWKSMLPH